MCVAPATSVPFIRKGFPRSPSADFCLNFTDHSCVAWRLGAKEAEKNKYLALPGSIEEVGKEKGGLRKVLI